jgi:hypothetical protein
MEKFDSVDGFESIGEHKPIRVNVLADRVVEIPQAVALDLVYAECLIYAATRGDSDVDSVDIGKPSKNEYENDAFHLFLALSSDIGIDTYEIRAVLEKKGGRDSSKLFEDNLAEARQHVESDDIKTGLSNYYDIVSGRFRRGVREYEKEQIIEADTRLIISAQAGNEESLAHIFNRNGDRILGDLEKHAHETPEDIIELSEQAVKLLIETSLPSELAAEGLNQAVQRAVRDSLLEKIPVYRESVAREQRENAIKSAVSRLKVAEYVSRLIDFEDLEEKKDEECIERPVLYINKQQVADVVDAGITHLKDRASGAINPKIDVLDNIINPDKSRKKRNVLIKEFGEAFRRHVLSSARMKQEGTEIFDITDIYEHKDYTTAWVKLVNRMINLTAETK